MPAPKGKHRKNTCKGVKADGGRCKAYAQKDSDYCHRHNNQLDLAEVVSITDRVKDGASHLSTREERLTWLDSVWKGELGDTRLTPKGDVVTIPASMKDRQEALKQLERMQHGADEDEDALDTLAERVRARLGI